MSPKSAESLQSKQVVDLLRFEERRSAGAQGSSTSELSKRDAELYQHLLFSNDGHKAEVQSMTGPIHPLLKLRTLVFRGRHAEAAQLLQKLESEQESGDRDERSSEIALEKARVIFHEGRWEECIRQCDQTLALNPIPLSLMTTFQLRAVALYELGRFNEAFENLERIESLVSVFCDAQSAFYSAITRLRVAGKLRQAPLEQRLEELRQTLQSRELNPDILLTVLRAEIECLTDAGEASGSQALACYVLSELMGDKLYSALALLDIGSQADPELQRLLVPFIEDAEKKFPRVRMLGSSEGKQTTSGALLLSPARKKSLGVGQWKQALTATHFYCEAQAKLIKLRPWVVSELAAGSQSSKVLVALSGGRLEKEEFFHAIWGSQKYAQHLHDGLIWNAIHRLRSRYNVEISIDSGRVEAQSVLFLK